MLIYPECIRKYDRQGLYNKRQLLINNILGLHQFSPLVLAKAISLVRLHGGISWVRLFLAWRFLYLCNSANLWTGQICKYWFLLMSSELHWACVWRNVEFCHGALTTSITSGLLRKQFFPIVKNVVLVTFLFAEYICYDGGCHLQNSTGNSWF